MLPARPFSTCVTLGISLQHTSRRGTLCIYMCLSAPFSFKEASREEAVDILLYTDNYRDYPHTRMRSWTRRRTRCHADTTALIPVIHCKHQYRWGAKSRVLKPKCAKHVSLYDCSRLCHRWSNSPISKSGNGPAIYPTWRTPVHEIFS